MSGDIASVAELARHLNETIPTTATAAAQQALESAQAAVQMWAGRDLVQSRSTVTLTVGAGPVALPDTPVTTVHSVTLDSVASTDWTLDADGVLWWPVAPAVGTVVVVDYTHGFAAGSREHYAARLLVLRQAERIYTNPRNRSTFNGPGPDGYSFVTDMPGRILTPDEQGLLSLIARPSGF